MDPANSSYNLLIYGNYFFYFLCFIFPPSSDYNICHIQGKLKYKKSLFSVEQETSTNLPEWKCKSFLVSWEHWPYYIYCLLKRKWFFSLVDGLFNEGLYYRNMRIIGAFSVGYTLLIWNESETWKIIQEISFMYSHYYFFIVFLCYLFTFKTLLIII